MRCRIGCVASPGSGSVKAAPLSDSPAFRVLLLERDNPPASRHPDTDEVFLVLGGSLTMRLDDGEVTLGPGQHDVVPRGVHHQPVSVDGAEVVLTEPSTTVNTGDARSHLTAKRRLA